MYNVLKKIGKKRSRPQPNGHGDSKHMAQENCYMKHYHRMGISRQLHYPSTTIAQLLDQSAQRYPHAPALIYDNLNWTYAELQNQVNRFAAGLATLGVRHGDRVMLLLPNCPEFVTAFLAIQKLGAIVVNAGPLIGTDDLAKLIEMTEARLIIALDLQAPALVDPCQDRPDLKCLWVTLKDYQAVWKRMGYRLKLWHSRHETTILSEQMMLHQLMAMSPARPPTVIPNPDDLAVLQPTGGTTGTQKVAQLSHRNLIANAAQLSVWAKLQPAQETVLGILPMFHVYGLSSCLITAIYNSAMILPLTRFNVDQVLKTIVQYRPTICPLVPVIVEAMCDKLEREPNPLVGTSLKQTVVISGAAPLTPTTSQRFERITNVRILQGYGLTEASPVTHANPMDRRREGSIGIPLPDTFVRVVDLQDPNQDVRCGDAGELWVSGPQVMQGYYKNPDENNNIFSVDQYKRRWLHTGDIVRMTDDGFYSVVGRDKEMINRGGLKVWPTKIEQLLILHPNVADVAVIGRPDPVHTETVTAIIQPADSSIKTHPLLGELKTLCRKHLASYEVPKEFEFVDRLPRSALGKMLKYQLSGHHNGNSNGNGSIPIDLTNDRHANSNRHTDPVDKSTVQTGSHRFTITSGETTL